MRKGGGKQKGSEFERDVCRDLSLWMSGGKREDLYWRSAMSGGRSTVAAKRGKLLHAQAGDVSSIDPAGEPLTSKFFIECKYYKSLDLSSVFNERGKLIEFWKMAKDSARKYSKKPMLFAKQNRFPTYICLDSGGMGLFALYDEASIYATQNDMYVMAATHFFAIGHPPGGEHEHSKT
jgi:hypothetical protein